MSDYLGSGSYGTVTLHPTDKTRCIKTVKPPYLKQSQITTRQAVLDTIDPPDKENKRKYFGGKIVDKTLRQGTNEITKFQMVLQGQSLEKVAMTPSTLDKLKKSFLNLLEGLCLLSLHKYSHNDIKKENITYDDASGVLKFIDHDLFLTKFKTNPLWYFYYPYAPELWPSNRYNYSNITAFNRYMKNSRFFTDKDVADFLKIMSFSDVSRLTLRLPIHWWIKELLDYLRDKSKHDDYSKTDVYSLGLVALQLFYDHVPELRPVIDKMIHPDPSKRCTAKEAYDMWKRILAEGIDTKPPTKLIFGTKAQLPPPGADTIAIPGGSSGVVAMHPFHLAIMSFI